MTENEQEEEYVFEETSIFESEWFEYSLYCIGLMVFGLFAPAIFSFNHELDLIAANLQKFCMFVGVCGLLFCIVKLVIEEYFTSDDNQIELSSKANLTTFEDNSLSNEQASLEPVLSNTIESKFETTTRKLSHQILDEMEWLRFEQICSAFLTRSGYKNSLTGLGADGGIDIKIYAEQSSEVVAVVQCKRVNNPVTVKLIREFYGVMSSQKIQKGYYMTTSTFNNNALEFASSLDIELIDGAELLRRVGKLSVTSQNELYELATAGDYKTPSCVKCGDKMVQRINNKTRERFWACNKYRCKTTLKIKSIG